MLVVAAVLCGALAPASASPRGAKGVLGRPGEVSLEDIGGSAAREDGLDRAATIMPEDEKDRTASSVRRRRRSGRVALEHSELQARRHAPAQHGSAAASVDEQVKAKAEEQPLGLATLAESSTHSSVLLYFNTVLVVCLAVYIFWRDGLRKPKVKHFGSGNEKFMPVTSDGHCVYIAGQVGEVADMAHTKAEEQAAQALAKVDNLLKLAGSSKDRVLFGTVVLRDTRYADEVNKAWVAWLGGDVPPARIAFGGVLLRETALVEISVVASV